MTFTKQHMPQILQRETCPRPATSTSAAAHCRFFRRAGHIEALSPEAMGHKTSRPSKKSVAAVAQHCGPGHHELGAAVGSRRQGEVRAEQPPMYGFEAGQRAKAAETSAVQWQEGRHA